MGITPLLGALHEMSRPDLAYQLLTNPENDIWTNWLEGQSQSLYEGPGYKVGKRYGGSQNHMYFGSYNEWIERDLAGIRPMFQGPAFQTILLQPAFVPDLQHIDWRFHSASGEIGTNWNFINDDVVSMSVLLPKETKVLFNIPEGYQVKDVDPKDLLLNASITNRNELSFMATSFSMELERAGVAKDTHIIAPKLYFDGIGIYSDQQADSGQSWDLEIYDLSGKRVHKKRLSFMVKHVPLLSIWELPDNYRGTFVGRLINLNTNKVEQSIKFVK